MLRWLSVVAVVLLAGCAVNRPVLPESGFMAGGMMFESANNLSTSKTKAFIKDNYIISIVHLGKQEIDDVDRQTWDYNESVKKARDNESFDSGKWHLQADGFLVSDKGFRAYKHFFYLPNNKNLYLLSVDCAPMYGLTCDSVKLLSVVLDAKTQSGQ